VTFQPANNPDTTSINPDRGKAGSHLAFLGEVHTGNDTMYHVIALWRADDGTFAWAAETSAIVYANGHGTTIPFQTLTLDSLTSGTIDEFTTAAQTHISEGVARFAGPHGQTRLDDLLKRAQQPSKATKQVADTPPRRVIKQRLPVPAQAPSSSLAQNASNGYGYDMSKSQFPVS